MALTTDELTAIQGLRRAGGHPTLIAKMLKRDPRVILDAIKRYQFSGPAPTQPTRPITKALQQKATDVICFTGEPDLEQTLSTLIDMIGGTSPSDVNLALKLLVTELEKLEDQDDTDPLPTPKDQQQ